MNSTSEMMRTTKDMFFLIQVVLVCRSKKVPYVSYKQARSKNEDGATSLVVLTCVRHQRYMV